MYQVSSMGTYATIILRTFPKTWPPHIAHRVLRLIWHMTRTCCLVPKQSTVIYAYLGFVFLPGDCENVKVKPTTPETASCVACPLNSVTLNATDRAREDRSRRTPGKSTALRTKIHDQSTANKKITPSRHRS